MEDHLNIGIKGHALDILSKFNEFRINQQHCDFIIKAGEKEIYVHKCVIAASSDYFAAMLNHDTKENRLGMVDLKQADPECVMICIEIMYTGQASFLIRKTEKLMYVAHLFGIDKVCDAMSLFLENNLDIDSFFDIRRIADKYSCQQLQQSCNSFARNHFHSIMKADDFKELEFEFLEYLISSEDLNMLDVIKCKASMIWVNDDLDRANKLCKLLKHIDLQKIPVSYRKFLSQQPTIAKVAECMMYIMKSIPEKSDAEASDYKVNFTPYILMVNLQLSRLMWFDVDRKSLTGLRHFNCEDNMRHSTSVAVMDCYIYVINDRCDLYRCNFLENDSPWRKLEREFPDYHAVVASKPGKFYLETDFMIESLAQYDTINDNWSKLPDKPSKVRGSAYTISQDKLYVIGGYDLFHEDDVKKYVKDVECFSFSTSTWSVGPSLPTERSNASACTYDKAIYLLGGITWHYKYVGSILRLPSDESIWTIIELLENDIHRLYLNTYCIDGKIYICGGSYDESPVSNILEFNPKTNLVNTLINFDRQDLKSLNYECYAAAIIV